MEFNGFHASVNVTQWMKDLAPNFVTTNDLCEGHPNLKPSSAGHMASSLLNHHFFDVDGGAAFNLAQPLLDALFQWGRESDKVVVKGWEKDNMKEK